MKNMNDRDILRTIFIISLILFVIFATDVLFAISRGGAFFRIVDIELYLAPSKLRNVDTATDATIHAVLNGGLQSYLHTLNIYHGVIEKATECEVFFGKYTDTSVETSRLTRLTLHSNIPFKPLSIIKSGTSSDNVGVDIAISNTHFHTVHASIRNEDMLRDPATQIQVSCHVHFDLKLFSIISLPIHDLVIQQSFSNQARDFLRLHSYVFLPRPRIEALFSTNHMLRFSSSPIKFTIINAAIPNDIDFKASSIASMIHRAKESMSSQTDWSKTTIFPIPATANHDEESPGDKEPSTSPSFVFTKWWHKNFDFKLHPAELNKHIQRLRMHLEQFSKYTQLSEWKKNITIEQSNTMPTKPLPFGLTVHVPNLELLVTNEGDPIVKETHGWIVKTSEFSFSYGPSNGTLSTKGDIAAPNVALEINSYCAHTVQLSHHTSSSNVRSCIP